MPVKEVYLNVYVGTDDDSFQDYLYGDLVRGTKEVLLECSSNSLEDLSEEDFLTSLVNILELAKDWAKPLGIPVRIDTDEMIEALGGDEAPENYIRAVKRLLREFKEEIR